MRFPNRGAAPVEGLPPGRRPKRSASDPPSRSSAESDSRYALTIHSCPLRLTWRSRLIAGRARNTTVSSRIVMSKPMMTATSVHRLRVTSVKASVLRGLLLGAIKSQAGSLPALGPDVERNPSDEAEGDRRVHHEDPRLEVHARVRDHSE